jgi:transposase InsO family protein
LPKTRRDRGVFRRLTESQKAALIRWRTENEYRTVVELQEELQAHETTGPSVPSSATIARFLRSKGLDRQTLRRIRGEKQPTKVRLAFEASYPQEIWQADTKGPDLYVQDPDHPGETAQAKLILFIDDYSRFCPAFAYVLRETEAAVMILFRQAVDRYGVPNVLYVDRGGPYMGDALRSAGALIGCRVIHTSPGDAAAKGKIEKKLRHIYEKLETELLRREPPTLAVANEYLSALLRQDYHHRVHSTTGQTPEERYLSFAPEYRRFVSSEALSLIFLPVERSHVTKTGLIRLFKKQYLVPNSRLYRQWVTVRYDPLDLSKVYVWFKDAFYGEAHLYCGGNDRLQQEELREQLGACKNYCLSELPDAPPYGYLERKLALYRMEAEKGLALNEELARIRAQKEHLRAELCPVVTVKNHQTENTPELDADGFVYLLSVLLHRRLTARERLLIHTAWRAYGPFTEGLIRKTVGRLLGESHPATDLSGFLDALRIAAEASPSNQ